MLISDFRTVGNRLLALRKQAGMTQAEVAEAAGLSDRTYADIERGTVNMRMETLLRICGALRITPDDILTQQAPIVTMEQEELLSRLERCSTKQRETIFRILRVYLDSLDLQ